MDSANPDWMEGLSFRARRGLRDGDYSCHIDVVLATSAQLWAIHRVGVKTLRELNRWRRPRTATETLRLAASLTSHYAAWGLTTEERERCQLALLADPDDPKGAALPADILELLYPTRSFQSVLHAMRRPAVQPRRMGRTKTRS